jgi:hypothetical protein
MSEAEVERFYVKFPGKEPADVSQEDRLDPARVRVHWGKLRNLSEKNSWRRYRSSHNHPGSNITPSERDIALFMENDAERAMVTGQKGVGYFLVRKTKATPQVVNWDYAIPRQSLIGGLRTMWDTLFRGPLLERKVASACKPYQEVRDDNPNSTFEQKVAAFDYVAKSLHLKYKVLRDLRGYDLKQIEPTRDSKLETSTLAASILCLAGSIFFLGSSLTGNTIANLSTNTTSWVGAVLLAIGLVAGVFWVRSKRK